MEDVPPPSVPMAKMFKSGTAARSMASTDIDDATVVSLATSADTVLTSRTGVPPVPKAPPVQAPFLRESRTPTEAGSSYGSLRVKEPIAVNTLTAN
jgi:hypothetical protein